MHCTVVKRQKDTDINIRDAPIRHWPIIGWPIIGV